MTRDSIYSENGDLVAAHGSIEVFSMNNEFYMAKDKALIYSSEALSDYIWQVNDKPYGNCLIVGLGLGVAAKYILSLPKVDSLTVIEEDDAIIKSQGTAGSINDDRFSLVNRNYLEYLYTNAGTFDFVLLDCYSYINVRTLPLIADLIVGARKAVTDDGVLIGWVDSKTPEALIEPFYSLFVKN